MNFDHFNRMINEQFAMMQMHTLYKVDVSKQDMWDTYLGAFPEGSNPIYQERTHHDCQCCKQFIRTVGNVVAVIGGKPVSIWEVIVNDDDMHYQTVADEMARLVQEADILHPFFHYESSAGTARSHSHEEDGTIKSWNHFQADLPDVVIMDKSAIATHLSKLRSKKQVFQRSLEEISPETVETVLELVGQKSLYRGEEHLATLKGFQTCQTNFAAMPNAMMKLDYLWACVKDVSPAILGIRNSAIGTLLVDLSEGKGLNQAVGAFEAMVAPANYKRPTALITKTMIKNAQATVEELGFSEALSRRHAVMEDITIPNVIFANRDTRKVIGGDVFDQLVEEQSVNPQNLSKVEEVDIETFISEVVPQATKIELLLENHQIGNLMTLVAPLHLDAPNMLKWDNNFSWTYNGDIADSMKQRVKAAGGNVEGVMRFSIQWNEEEYNGCDYDAHCIEPDGFRTYFGVKGHPRDKTGCILDVDIITPHRGTPAVENITWADERRMQSGEYRFLVHCYSVGSGNTGFKAEFEYQGQIHSYSYDKPLKPSEYVEVVKGTLIPGSSFEVTKELPSTLSSREVWSIPTMQYQNVSMMMLSPNHWDENDVGNKHYFFILEGCKQPGKIRGFYNEFLTDKLREHRKVFEVLGAKMKAEESDTQLSGLGFSSTQRNHVFAKVSGSFDRTIKITF